MGLLDVGRTAQYVCRTDVPKPCNVPAAVQWTEGFPTAPLGAMPTDFSEGEYALHRYFLWANRMRAHLLQSGVPPTETLARRAWLQRAFPYAATWLGFLQVLTEGWAELRLDDATIDELMRSPNVTLLRRFRNGAFHFQRTYYDARFLEFLRDPTEPLAWATTLHNAFGDWFLRRARALGIQMPDLG
jgi:hypothetical protein